ncbi:MAG TPA: glycoside hydrolase family 97 C-terminal domain-containing protein, partial [Chitinophagaceae bacterium]|nr:glycoside hydrolase family 97 C-terminal domain-containing protein [Chitinophagaceae bacterium]
LEAEPGDFITIARKAKGKQEWFVGGITDENPRTANIDFNFLDSKDYYVATIYEDGKEADYMTNPQSYHIYKVIVNNQSKLPQKLAASGGVAISLKKATANELKTLKKME